MSSRRTVILIVAVVAGAFAALGIMNYVRNVENSANEAGAVTQIWVVKAPIPKGTPAETALEQQLIGRGEVAEGFVAATAVVDPAVELAGLVAIADLDVNMPVVSGFFASPSVVQTGIADRLEERGLVTVTFNVDQARGAAYLVEPGDRVNILVERPWDSPFYDQDPPIEVSPESTAELAEILEDSGTSRPILSDIYPVDVRYVYQYAEVLAVGASITPDIGQDGTAEEQVVQDRGLITLAVPPEAAQTILAVGRENIYLSLVPIDYEPRAIQPQDPTRQVFPGETDDALTPYDEAEAAGFAVAGDLPYTDGESRIGTTPSGDADVESETTDPAVPTTTTPPTTVPETTESSAGTLGSEIGGSPDDPDTGQPATDPSEGE